MSRATMTRILSIALDFASLTFVTGRTVSYSVIGTTADPLTAFVTTYQATGVYLGRFADGRFAD